MFMRCPWTLSGCPDTASQCDQFCMFPFAEFSERALDTSPNVGDAAMWSHSQPASTAWHCCTALRVLPLLHSVNMTITLTACTGAATQHWACWGTWRQVSNKHPPAPSDLSIMEPCSSSTWRAQYSNRRVGFECIALAVSSMWFWLLLACDVLQPRQMICQCITKDCPTAAGVTISGPARLCCTFCRDGTSAA
jgi:hypothetical protein